MSRGTLGDNDYKAALAFAIFPVAYGGFLIVATVANQPPPKLDATGHPIRH
jgi:hypothetical protein